MLMLANVGMTLCFAFLFNAFLHGYSVNMSKSKCEDTFPTLSPGVLPVRGAMFRRADQPLWVRSARRCSVLVRMDFRVFLVPGFPAPDPRGSSRRSSPDPSRCCSPTAELVIDAKCNNTCDTRNNRCGVYYAGINIISLIFCKT